MKKVCISRDWFFSGAGKEERVDLPHDYMITIPRTSNAPGGAANGFFNGNSGPNHVKNYCDAPIMADTQKDEIFFHSSYYYIGHFSKFIKAGAVRIATSKWRADIEVCPLKIPTEIVSVLL